MADNEIRIKDLTETTSLASGDNFVIDNANSRGTKRFPYSEFKKLTPLIFNNWTPLTTYQKDAFVTYEGKLYHNKTGSSVNAQTWQGSSVWEEVVLDDYLLNIVKNFVPLYSGGNTYNVSDYVVRGYKLYRCKTDGATGVWDSSKWVETNIISYIKNIVLNNFSAKRITSGVAESVSKGDIYIIKDYMYRAKEDTTTDPLDMSKWETVTVESLLTDMADEIEESIEPSIETALALGTASGSIASFTDGSTLPMKKLEVDIEPVQSGSGEPSPTNVRPISGWDECNVGVVGKNLAEKVIHGYIKTDTSKVVIDNDSESVVFYAVEGETYKISSSVTMNRSIVGLVNTDNITNQYPVTEMIDLGNSVTTWTATWSGWTVWYKCSSGNSDFANSVQVELGSQATAYEPYNGQTYTIDLDGTRYGGTLDVVSGVLTVDRAYIEFDGSESWDIYTNTGVNQLYTSVPNAMSSSSKVCTLCDTYKSISISNRANNYNTCYSGSNSICFNIENTTVAEWKALLQANNVQVVYELATPQTIQLTPTEVKSLLATNNIFADTGEILDATYVRNSDIVINDLIERGGGFTWDYSTTEVNTGQKWIDGNDIYCKVINSTLTGATTSFNIPNVSTYIKTEGYVLNSTSTYSLPLTYYENANYRLTTQFDYNNSNLDVITTATLVSYYPNVVAIAYYTKSV